MQALDCQPSTTERGVTLLLIGKAGTGRSSVGNLILGRHAFRNGRSLSAVTQQCQQESTLENGRQSIWRQGTTVIDTPGLCADAAGDEATKTEIEAGLKLAASGPNGLDAVLLTLNLSSRATREDFQCIHTIRSLLGPKCFRERVVVVWTHADLLLVDGVSPTELLATSAVEAVKDLLEEVQQRSVVLDARSSDPSSMHRLLEVVRGVVEAHAGDGFRAADAPKKMRMKQARRLRQLAVRKEENATGNAGSWFGWMMQLVAPTLPPESPQQPGPF